MNYRWLLAFNNFCGVCFIKITNQNEWRESKIFIIIGFLKTILLFILILLFASSEDFKNNLFKEESVLLKEYSEFSKRILNIAAQCLFFCALTISIVQYLRRRKILKFFKAFVEYNLRDESKIKLLKACKSRMIVNLGMNFISIFIRNFRILKNDYPPTYILWFLSTELYLVITSIFIFFCNFQQFIIIALNDIRIELDEYMWNNDKILKLFTKLMKIENFLMAFEENFGLQLTLISTNFVFSIVTYVSFLIIIQIFEILEKKS